MWSKEQLQAELDRCITYKLQMINREIYQGNTEFIVNQARLELLVLILVDPNKPNGSKGSFSVQDPSLIGTQTYDPRPL